MSRDSGFFRSLISLIILIAIEIAIIVVSALLFTLVTDWEFKDAAFYAINLFTTIGYEGPAACGSDDNGCLLLTIFLGFFGISFTIITLGLSALNLGRLLDIADEYSNKRTWVLRAVSAAVTMLVLFCIIALIPTVWVWVAYEWEFLPALYFIFMTFSTVGMTAGGEYSVQNLYKEGEFTYYIMMCWCFIGFAIYLAGVRYMYYKLFARWCGENVDSSA